MRQPRWISMMRNAPECDSSQTHWAHKVKFLRSNAQHSNMCDYKRDHLPWHDELVCVREKGIKTFLPVTFLLDSTDDLPIRNVDAWDSKDGKLNFKQAVVRSSLVYLANKKNHVDHLMSNLEPRDR